MVHLIALILFIVVMLLWALSSVSNGVTFRGSGWLPWLAVALLAFLTLAHG